MKVITITNQKGGVGKTTTAVNLAHGLALQGREVLVIDLDPQGQAATFLGTDQEPGVFGLLVQEQPLKSLIRQARERLWLLPGNRRTADAGTILAVMQAPIDKLSRVLPRKNGLDYVIIDTAPSVSMLQAMGIYAADLLLMPTACDSASVHGLTQLEASVVELQRKFGWKGEIGGILPTFYDDQTGETRRVVDEMRELYSAPGLMIHPIHRATVLRECAAEGKTIFELDGNSRAASEYAHLVHHVMKLK